MEYQEWQAVLFPSLGKADKKKELMNNLRDINWAIYRLNKYEHRGFNNWKKHCCSDMCYARDHLTNYEGGDPVAYEDLMLTAYEAIAIAEKYEREAREKALLLEIDLPKLPVMPKGFA